MFCVGFFIFRGAKMKNMLSFLILITLLAVGIYFFQANKLGAPGFITFNAIVILSGLALYGFDRLKEVDLKNLKLVLNEMKETKMQVFAKAEEVNKVMEGLAENYISSASEAGRLPDESSLHEQMINKRKRAEELLEKAGWKKEDIANKIENINKLIIRDMAYGIEYAVYKILKERRNDRKIRHLGAVDKKFINLINEAKSDDEIVEKIKEYLTNCEVPLERFQKELDNLGHFLKTKELRS